jgi:hypothetical protein
MYNLPFLLVFSSTCIRTFYIFYFWFWHTRSLYIVCSSTGMHTSFSYFTPVLASTQFWHSLLRHAHLFGVFYSGTGKDNYLNSSTSIHNYFKYFITVMAKHLFYIFCSTVVPAYTLLLHVYSCTGKHCFYKFFASVPA